jgi:hypothetical protein
VKSLAMCAFKAALQGREVTHADSTTTGCEGTRADSALTAALSELQEAGVDTTKAWSLEVDIPPLLITACHSCFGASQMLLDAGTDVNATSSNRACWPLLGPFVHAPMLA